MTTLHLPPELDSFIATKIRSGSYQNASQVIEAALLLLEQEELEDDAKMQAVLREVDEGEASGMAEGDVFERIRQARALRRQQPVTIG